MKHFSQRALSFLLILCILTALFATSVSAKNTDRRGTDCTSLSSQATAYYTGNYTYDTMSKLQGGTEDCLTAVNSAMYKRLQTLMSTTMTNRVSYSSLTKHWPTTDGNLLFYSDVVSSSYNREHVWPKSRASFKKTNGGSDLHHLRPTDSGVNTVRSNYTMGNVQGVISGYSTYQYNGKNVLYYSPANDLVEVNDYVKGDVARILLYVYVRWGEPNLFMNTPNPVVGPSDDKNNGLKVIESLDTLLEWCELDPVDTWEMKRNDEVQNIQGNRNVFIDYPEYSWLLFGQEVPNDMTTPSGKAKEGGSTPACKHTNTKTEEQPATCTADGYVRTVCVDCDKTIEEKITTALGHDFQNGKCTRCNEPDPNYKPDCKHENTEHQLQEATCTTGGADRVVCKDCGRELSSTATPALGHAYQNGVCTRCGAADPNAKPVNTPKYTDFSDLPISDWYTDAVSYVLENGLMNGVSKREFDPEGELTRAMFVTILYRAEKTPDISGKTNRFTDVPANEWYTDAVVWASDNGIVTGTSHTTFAPDTPITREQIATILYRYSKAARTSQTLAAFPDAREVSAYAYDAMCWAVAEGILNGSDGKLLPQDNATRVQIAAILMRYLEK